MRTASVNPVVSPVLNPRSNPAGQTAGGSGQVPVTANRSGTANINNMPYTIATPATK